MSAASSKQQLQECFICHTMIHGDVGVFERHVNQCLDASREAPPASDMALEQDKIDEIDEVNEISDDDDEQVPPPRAAVEQIVISDSEDEADIDDTRDDGGCPICDQQWRLIDLAPVQGSRDAHVGQCLEHDGPSAEPSEVEAEEEEAEEDDDDDLTVVEAGSSSPPLPLRKGFGAIKKPRLLDGRDTEPKATPGEQLGALLSHSTLMGPRKLSPVWTTLLANQHTQFVRGQVWDLGWGCGYRNAQMLYSSLRHLPEYNISANSIGGPPPVPSILELQGVIEDAWKAGHDLDGAAHFKGKLRGSKQWTGPTEMYTAFTALRIRCQIVDFPKLPHSKEAIYPSLVRWIVAYFTDTLQASYSSNSAGDIWLRTSSSFSSSILPVMTAKQPLFLQHQGHSRTVVGIEYDEQGEGYLLLFDPGRRVPPALKKAASKLPDTMSTQSTSPLSSKKRPLSSSSTTSTTRSCKAFWAQSPHARLKPDPTDSKALFEPTLLSKIMANAAMMSLPSTGLTLKSLSTFRVGFKSLSRKDQYQILYVEPGPLLSAEEVEERKAVKSSRVVG